MATSPTYPVDPDAARRAGGALQLLHGAEAGRRGTAGRGQRGTGYAPRMFVQNTPPDVTRDGDFWLVQGTSTTLNVSLGGQWVRSWDTRMILLSDIEHGMLIATAAGTGYNPTTDQCISRVTR